MAKITNVQEILDTYRNTGSTKETANVLGIKQARVQYVTRKYNVLKGMSESRRKYTFNEHYFDDIDTEHKAYWLGFLFADGCVCYEDQTPRLAFVLSGKDVNTVKRFTEDLGSNAPIVVRDIKTGKFKGKNFASFQVRSKYLCDVLEKHGCIRRKSTRMKFPSINIALIPHFIRGYFDGNGSVFISREKHWRHGTITDVLHFRFVGTYDMMSNIDKFLNLHGQLKIAHPDYDNSIYELSYKRRKKAKVFYNYLYSNATIYLERKKAVFDLHFKERCSETIISQPV